MLWKAGMAILVVCLVASIAIAVVRLATTPTEILGEDLRGLPAPGKERGAGDPSPAAR
jgi:hypothetical protein